MNQPPISPTLSRQLSEEVASLSALVRQSVVLVYKRGGNGAGVIWRSDGQVITNNHVVSSSGRAEVVLADGRKFIGIVAARHPTRDLAILKIAAEDLPAIAVGDSDLAFAGQLVFSLGHPLGLRDAVSMGVVTSPVDRESDLGDEPQHLHTDLWIRPGSSGGPIFNHLGQALAISTLVSGEKAMGIPSNAVEQFVRDHEVSQSESGFGIEQVTIASPDPEFRTALLVSSVKSGSRAEAAGLIPGDILYRAGNSELVQLDDLRRQLAALPPDATLSLLYSRGGTKQEIQLSGRG